VELLARFQEFKRIYQGRMKRGLIPYKSIGIIPKLQISEESPFSHNINPLGIKQLP